MNGRHYSKEHIGTAAIQALEPRLFLAAQMVRDIHAEGSSDPQNLVNVNGTLFFTAIHDIYGVELWRSDGTKKGTVLVRDLVPGLGEAFIMELTAVGSTLLFVADNGIHGAELWRSDGTKKGTVLVRDVNPGATSSAPSGLVEVDGTLFFAASNGIHGFELWKSDGTKAGTRLVKDISPGPDDAQLGELTAASGVLFFKAQFDLWASYGTKSGTFRVVDIDPFSPDQYGDHSYADIGHVTAQRFSNNVYFVLSSGTAYSSTSYHVGRTGEQPGSWVSLGEFPSSVSSLIDTGGQLYASFSRRDDIPSNGGVWIVEEPLSQHIHEAEVSGLTQVGYLLYFLEVESGSLWRTDGTPQGTVLLRGAPNGNLCDVNSTLYFASDDGRHGTELWRSDSTPEGTGRISDIIPGRAGSDPQHLTNVNGTLFFTADDGIHGRELWVLRSAVG